MRIYSIPRPRLPVLAAGLFGLSLAITAAAAQDYGRSDDTYYRSGPPEEVEVTAPPYGAERGSHGGDIIHASSSKEVRYDDLDLRTAWGARALRNRIRTAATMLCEQLDRRYPVATDDNPSCYREAMADAMEQADAAIDRARSYASAD